MSQPVKLSSDLIEDARTVGKIADRSIAKQIEWWAQIGRAVVPLLDEARALARIIHEPTLQHARIALWPSSDVS